jgi:predicted transposase YbfD/YdcC
VNECPAIPSVLDELAIKGSVVTADALNCQKLIAEKIREKEADYFLAVKGNQGSLLDDIKGYFLNAPKFCKFYEEADKGHGRVEHRTCWTTSDIKWLQQMHPEWKDLNSICMIESERFIRGKSEKQKRYYISSTQSDPKKHLFYSREHWQVENNLHWVLDVVFKEDQATLAEQAAHNMAVMRKLILNMIKRYKKATGEKIAIKSMRKVASWSNDAAAEILKHLAVTP